MHYFKRLSLVGGSLFVAALLLGDVQAQAVTERAPSAATENYSASACVSPKAFYDINLTSAASLRDFLGVINSTYDLYVSRGVPPWRIKFVVSLRGPSVTFVTYDFEDPTDPSLGGEIRELLATLASKNVRVEACEISLVWMSVNPSDLEPGIVVIDNAFASSIWYQTNSYALIPISQLPAAGG